MARAKAKNPVVIEAGNETTAPPDPLQDRAPKILSASVPESTLLVLHRDSNLVLLLSIWQYVPIQRRSGRKRKEPEPFASNALADWLWSLYRVDHDSIAKLLGKTFPAARIVRRAQRLRLVYPDGTIHPRAEHYLRAATSEALNEMGVVREDRKDRKKREEQERKKAEDAQREATEGGGPDATE